MTNPTLTVNDGALYLGKRILLCVYEAGDCDICRWPMGDETISSYPREKQERNLRWALEDMRETVEGFFNVQAVILPDGTVFNF